MKRESTRTIESCQSAPDFPAPMVYRPHIVQTLVQISESNAEIILLEGPVGIGKTIFLREFWGNVEAPCFGIFFRGTNRSYYDPVLARIELSSQVCRYINTQKPASDFNLTEGELRKLWNQCSRRLIREHKLGYVIIDGLYHISENEDLIKKSILNLLPFGLKPFKFIFSNKNDSDKIFDGNRYSVKEFPLLTFSPHETDQFLREVVEEKSTRSQFHSLAEGSPSKLASIRRLIETSANSPESVLETSQSTDLDSLFEAEWQQISPLSKNIDTVLGFLLAYGSPTDSKTVSEYCSINSLEVEKIFSSIPFMKQTDNLQRWDFSTDSFRKYAEKKLSKSIRSATEVIAKQLLNEPESDESILHLPHFLEQSGNVENLRNWLDANRISTLLLKNKSAAHVDSILQRAINICSKGKDQRGVIAYSIIRSTIRQISKSSALEYEIRARCALGDFESAMSIANDVPLHTQRLRLLAVLASSKTDHPKHPTQQLIEEIHELHRKMNVSELDEEEAIDIAIDLYPVDPKLALSILKEISQDEFEETNFEIAIARITLETIMRKTAETFGEGDSQGNRSDKPKRNIKLQKLIEAYTKSNDMKSGSEVLEAISNITDVSERLFLQRKWILQHSERDDALDVVQNAINEAISIVEYTPNATFYREIATPLPYVTGKDRRNKIISIIDGQSQIIQHKGPTIDYVRLQLCLVRCNCIDYEFQNAINRLEELTLNYLDDIDEIEDKITCLAWISTELDGFDLRNKSCGIEEVAELVESEFQKALNYVLRNCANQFEILSRSLEALAKYKQESAFKVSQRLNTVESRNEAYSHIISSMCEADVTKLDCALLFEILDKIELLESTDLALIKITKCICREIESGRQNIDRIEDILRRIDRISALPIRIRCLARMLKLMATEHGTIELRDQIEKDLLSAFKSSTSHRIKYRLACDLISSLRSNCPEPAQKFYDYLANRDMRFPVSEGIEQGYFFLADLITKVIYALAKARLITDNDFKKICSIIDKMYEPYLNIKLFSTLAFFLWTEGQLVNFSKIIQNHILIQLNRFDSSEKSLVYDSWCNAYPVIWLENRDFARDKLNLLPSDIQNQCISNLIQTILRKQPIGEPFEGGWKSEKDLNFNDIQNLLSLCEETNEDTVIFQVFETIASTVTVKKANVALPSEQKAEITRRMLEIAEKRLPKKDRIQHTGFQILCKAQALRISVSNISKWDALIEEGKSLVNVADRIYVLAHIATYLPGKRKKQSLLLLQSTESDADKLKVIEDQVGRYCLIAELIAHKDKSKATSILKKAFGKVTQQSNGRRDAVSEKHVIDIAYKIDPDLPLQLALLYDDDPARESYKKRAQKQLDAHKLRKEIGDTRSNVGSSKFDGKPNLANIFWRALGFLNSGRTIPVEYARAIEFIVYAGNFPISDSYPYYSWAISNVMLKYAETTESNEYLYDFFESILESVQFLHCLMEGNEHYNSSPEWRDIGDSENQIMIRPGERDKAFNFIRNWLNNYAEGTIMIMDPYFNNDKAALEILRVIVEINPHLKVHIITGKPNQPKNGRLSTEYSDSWRHFCDHSPPETEFLIVGSEKIRKVPFHDRWILTDSRGLRLGTSIASLGNRDCEISVLGNDEVKRIYSTVKRYQNKEVREYSGDRVVYESFELLS